jgi:transcriptional regulator with PAS, ATPase and Fis domain
MTRQASGTVGSPSLRDDELRRIFDDLGFITGSDALVPLLRQAYKAAYVSDVTILIEGETGTGKQVLASAIHQLDEKRKVFPFVTLHCGTLNDSLAESELFGHRKGAFTGAVANRKGLFQAAHQGTLFLDDVSDLPLHLQAKLLDVLQRGTVRSMGSDEERRVDVRIIAATNQPLKPLVHQGRWRADLYHRLNVVRLGLPALRARMHDLCALLFALARRHGEIYQPIDKIEDELLSLLYVQDFPGNVRELENDVQRMLFSKISGSSLGLADWRGRSTEPESGECPDLLGHAAARIWEAISVHGVSYTQAMHQVESKVLDAALKQSRTRRQLAEFLQTSERTLYHKMRTYGLNSTASR